ncbi:MAG: hypothetical protein JJ863_01740 [Deltaproteobacteria bacterium]|nr:hypothetical protein [Deltaproteobacteria bacterium]
MSALTSLLVRDQRVAVRKIEEAIQRQVIAGGSLDTVLLELNVVAENVLAAYCGVIHGLEPATRAELLGVDPDVIRLVPAPVAERHRLVPLAFANRTLRVAVSAPLEPETEQQLAFLLGVELEQRAVAEASLENALHTHYGIQLSPRIRRLGKKLAERDAGEIPYVAPLEQNTAERSSDGEYANVDDDDEAETESPEEGKKKREGRHTSRFGVVAEPKLIERESSISVTASGPPRRPTQELASRPPPAPDVTADEPAPPAPEAVPPPAKQPARGRISRAKGELLRRHRGPLTAARAVELLAKADHRDDILEVGFAFTRQFFDFCALFVVQDEEAELLDAAPMDDDALKEARQVVAPLAEPSTFALVYEGLVSAVGKLQRSTIDEQVRDALGRTNAQPSVLAPVMIRQRVVLFLYGDRNGEAFGLEDVPELVAFTPKLGEAFQQLILRRKFRGYAQGDARTSEAPDAPDAPAPASDGRSPQLPGEPPKPEAAWKDQKTRSPMKKLEASEEAQERVSRDFASATAAATKPEPEPVPERAPEPEPEPEARGSEPPVEEVRVGSRPLAAPAEPETPTEPEAKPQRAFRPSDVRTAPVSEGPTPLERAVESSLPAPRKRRKRSKTFDALGVPRSAPPPPMGSDEGEEDEDPAPTIVEAQDDAEPVLLSRTKSAPPDDDDDDEMELVVEDADDETAAEVAAAAAEEEITTATPLPETSAPPEPSVYKAGGQTDVIGGGRPRKRPRAGDTKDARSEGGRRAVQTDVVPASRRPTPSQPPPSDPPAERPTKVEVRHADTLPSETPSIIVEMDESIEDAVRGLSQVGPDSAEAEIAQIVALGEQALPVLTRDFPGLLWFDRSRPHRRLPRGRDISAVARAIAAFGDRAVPYVIPVLDHEGSDERFYATLLASEFRHPMLVEPLGRRVFDRDERTAALAVDVLRMQRRFSGPLQDVVEGLRAEARVPRSDIHKRVAAARALGALRDVGSLVLFVQLLGSDKPALVQEALRSLVALTKQDFGDNVAKWESWAEQNGHRHRIEWLIDALLHNDERLRADAGEELKRLTQEYYGYHPALPKRDREVAQRKYRDWWSNEGQRRFDSSAP